MTLGLKLDFICFVCVFNLYHNYNLLHSRNSRKNSPSPLYRIYDKYLRTLA